MSDCLILVVLIHTGSEVFKELLRFGTADAAAAYTTVQSYTDFTVRKQPVSRMLAKIAHSCSGIHLQIQLLIIMSVLSVSSSPSHTFSKTRTSSINLVKDLGVEGDCHNGHTVQHRSRLSIKPPPLNLRQVHLMPNEILADLGVEPAELGENITTTGCDLLLLGKGTKIHFLPASVGTQAQHEDELLVHPVLRITGLRNPCPQIEKFRAGLQEKFITRNEDRKIVDRKAGVMSVVEVGGTVQPGMRLEIEKPQQFEPLTCV